MKADHYINTQRRLAGLPPTYLAGYSEDELPTMPATTRLKRFFLKGKRALATASTTTAAQGAGASSTAAASGGGKASADTSSTEEEEMDPYTPDAGDGARDGNARQSTTPAPLMPKDVIQNGGFLVYLLGIVYAFNGIALVT